MSETQPAPTTTPPVDRTHNAETIAARPITLLDLAKGALEAGKILWTHRDTEGREITRVRDLLPAVATAFMRKVFPEITANKDRWQDVFTVFGFAQRTSQDSFASASSPEDLMETLTNQIDTVTAHLQDRGLPAERIALVKKGFNQLLAVKAELMDQENLTVAQLEEYKMLFNGIMVTIGAQMLLGDVPELPALSAQSDLLDWRSPEAYAQVRNEYGWVLDGTPRSATEKRLLALHHTLMATGIFDDVVKLDVAPDDISYWTTATSADNDKQRAQAALFGRIEEHLRLANQFGASRWFTVPAALIMRQAAPILQPALLGLDSLYDRMRSSKVSVYFQQAGSKMSQFDPRPHRAPLQNQPPSAPSPAPEPVAA